MPATVVCSYKTLDETSDQPYTTANGKPCGLVVKAVDILEQDHGHDVYIEMRDMKAGTKSFKVQVNMLSQSRRHPTSFHSWSFSFFSPST